MKRIVWIFCLFVQVRATAQGHFAIHGSFTRFDAAWIFLAYKGANGPVWDSAEVKDRGYTFEGSVKDPTTMGKLFYFYKDAETGETEVVEADLFLDTCTIWVNHTDSFSNTSFMGSVVDVEFGKLQKAAAPFDARLDSAKRLFKDAARREDVKGMSSAHRLIRGVEVDKSETVYARYLMHNPSSPVAFYALNHYDVEDSAGCARLRALFEHSPDSLRRSPWGLGFGQVLAKIALTALGVSARDFVQPDTTGQPVRLSAYRGHYVLLDFWASWCSPCRQENPNLLKAYAKYHSQGLDILGVSMDNDRGKWLKAIREDHLPWRQVSDLLGWKNVAAQLYQVKFIPRNFLIDPRGKIVAKDLIGRDLNEQLEMIFEK